MEIMVTCEYTVLDCITRWINWETNCSGKTGEHLKQSSNKREEKKKEKKNKKKKKKKKKKEEEEEEEEEYKETDVRGLELDMGYSLFGILLWPLDFGGIYFNI